MTNYLQYFIIFIQDWCIWSGSTNVADAFCVRCKLHSTFCAYCITRIEHSRSCKQNIRVLKLFHTKHKWTGSYFLHISQYQISQTSKDRRALLQKFTYMGHPESFRTFKIAHHCIDLAGRGKCYSLVMSLTNCVAKTALPYLA